MLIRISLLAMSAIVMVFFWHHPFIMPLKVFVVFLHELSHAIGALFTGGKIEFISINWDESGFTRTRGGNFLAITSAGYLGSILIGSMMLRTAIIARSEKIVSVFIGAVLIIFPLIIVQKLSQSVFIMGIVWGLAFITSGLLSVLFSRLILFVMGGLTSLYSVYDLGDFFRGDILKTDAGIIAGHYIKNETSVLILAYLIGILISILSIWILYRMVHNALHLSNLSDEEEPQINEVDLQQLELISSLTPESIEMIVKMHEERRNTSGQQ
jgi:hypothetical protein